MEHPNIHETGVLCVMTIAFKNGDMFREPVQALVNTVNCVGVMGKGVALEFKRRWPANFDAYRRICDAKALSPGKMFVFDRGGLVEDGPRYLINFPTKAHWKSKSELSYVTDGLDDLVRVIAELDIKSIALPPLGCGNGGLDWADVKPLIEDKLGSLNDVKVVVFAPKGEQDAPEHASAPFAMTFERAILLKSLNELEPYFDGSFDRISLQKIAYFLQALGVNFRLDFAKNLHGPYSEILKKAYITLEQRGMIKGFFTGDRQAHVTPSGCAAADDFLAHMPNDGTEIIDRLNKLIQGYESPYGLELLSSVHWLAHHEKHYPVEKIISALKGWNDHKNTFADEAVRVAYRRLVDDGLLN